MQMDAASQPFQIPWQSRKGIGSAGGFFRTAWLVTFKTRTFCQAMSQPVDFARAALFRRIVLMILFAICVAVSGYFFTPSLYGASGFSDSSFWFEAFPLWMNIILFLSGLFGLWLFLEGFTGLHTYWFHPKQLSVEQQNRSLALSHYACAPLLFVLASLGVLVVGIALIFLGYQMHSDTLATCGRIVMCAGAFLAAVFILMYWRVCFVLAREAAQRKVLGRWSLVVLQPILILSLGVLTFSIWPVMVFYTLLMLSAWA